MDISNSIKNKMQNFTKAIRYGNSNDKNIKMYRDFIIGNVSSVIDNTFPYFSSYASTDLKDQLIKVFLQDNFSVEPAFHQIATEVLKSSKKVKMTDELAKLIEFEWLLFSIEISSSKVCKNKKIYESVDFQSIRNISANPTLTFISLPFEVSSLLENINTKDQQFYALYRNINHKTSYQKISPIEFATISSALEKGVEVFKSEDFQEAVGSKYKDYLINRMVSWHNQNMIVLSI